MSTVRNIAAIGIPIPSDFTQESPHKKGKILNMGTGEIREFCYNPSSILDEKAIIYEETIVPGYSGPVYQYVAGGARTISLDILISGEGTGFNTLQQDQKFIKDTKVLKLGEESQLKIPESIKRLYSFDKSIQSIVSDVRFYQSLAYPEDIQKGKNTPPYVRFYFGDVYGGDVRSGQDKDLTLSDKSPQTKLGGDSAIVNTSPSITIGKSQYNRLAKWIVFDNVKVEWLKMDRNLKPYRALVSIVLKEVVEPRLDGRIIRQYG